MATVLVVCATHRDRRELIRIGRGHEFFWHDYASLELEDLTATHKRRVRSIRDPLEEVDHLLTFCRERPMEAVLSTDDYPGTALAAVVARHLGLPGTLPAVNLRTQHKFHCRVAQRRIRPDAVPAFRLCDRRHAASLAVPVFVKPVKSFFSVGAVAIPDDSSRASFARGLLPRRFFAPFNRLLATHGDCQPTADRAIAETLLHGAQVTVEGYAYDGHVTILGIVDSIMYPGTIAFRRFEYPSSLPHAVQARMRQLACDLMTGLGYAHGLFNIELIYDTSTGAIHVIEINPRMSSQFADLFEKVDGTNAYDILVDLALGRTPRVAYGEGRYRFAASCVLRRFTDAFVTGVPAEDELRSAQRLDADARIEILATPGAWLSSEMQDSCSYRYALVSVGGSDRGEALEKACELERRLPFAFRAAATKWMARRGSLAGSPAAS